MDKGVRGLGGGAGAFLSPSALRGEVGGIIAPMTQAVAIESARSETPYRPRHAVRLITAAALFDGHDAAINVMRRILQGSGAEIVHLGHNRSVAEVVEAAVQEDAQGVALTSYQVGHVEYFTYLRELLDERGAKHVRIYGGGGGVIVPATGHDGDDGHDEGRSRHSMRLHARCLPPAARCRRRALAAYPLAQATRSSADIVLTMRSGSMPWRAALSHP